MRNIVLVLCFFLIAGRIYTRQNKYELLVIVDGIEKISGKIEIALYNDAERFPKDNGEYASRSVPVESDTIKCVFYVPAGEYAIALYHDENNNDRFDKNIFGIPKEGFAFSNNVKPFVSAPSFRACKFIVPRDNKIEITLLHYPYGSNGT
jgi:uncharacterized protein (DUF2141 family)